MGILSRFKSSQEFIQLRREVQQECATLVHAFPSLEPYEIYLRIWTTQMLKRQRPDLAEKGEHAVVYFSLLPIAASGTEPFARYVAAHVVDGFESLPQFKQLNYDLSPIMASAQQDGGQKCNSIFKATNPKSHATFIVKHSTEPFTEPDLGGLASGFQYR